MKWRLYPDDVLPLWVAEMDCALAEPVVRSVTDALARYDTGYAWGSGLAQAYAGFAADRWGGDTVTVEHTAVVPDVMLGIVAALRLVSPPGSVVVLSNPVYPPFYEFVRQSGRRVFEAPLVDSRLDLDGLEAAFLQAAHGGSAVTYLLCNPQNPTGTVHTREELSTLAELAARCGVRVVADEIHAPLAGSGFTPYLAADHTGRGLVLGSASKGWNLAGLKAALLLAGPAAVPDLERLPEEVGHGVSHLGVIAHTAAFRDGTDWLDALLASLARRRNLLGELLAEFLPGVHWSPGEATYLAWLDVAPLGLAGDPAEFFLDRARVALSSGLPFGSGAEGFVRLNFATSTGVLREAVERMGRSLL